MGWTDFQRLLDAPKGERPLEAWENAIQGNPNTPKRALAMALEKKFVDYESDQVADVILEMVRGLRKMRTLLDRAREERDDKRALADHFRKRLNEAEAADNRHRRELDRIFEYPGGPPPG